MLMAAAYLKQAIMLLTKVYIFTSNVPKLQGVQITLLIFNLQLLKFGRTKKKNLCVIPWPDNGDFIFTSMTF